MTQVTWTVEKLELGYPTDLIQTQLAQARVLGHMITNSTQLVLGSTQDTTS